MPPPYPLALFAVFPTMVLFDAMPDVLYRYKPPPLVAPLPVIALPVIEAALDTTYNPPPPLLAVLPENAQLPIDALEDWR